MNSIRRFAIPYQGLIIEDFLLEMDSELHAQVQEKIPEPIDSSLFFTVTWENTGQVDNFSIHNEECKVPANFFHEDDLIGTSMYLLFNLREHKEELLVRILTSLVYVLTYRYDNRFVEYVN